MRSIRIWKAISFPVTQPALSARAWLDKSQYDAVYITVADIVKPVDILDYLLWRYDGILL